MKRNLSEQENFRFVGFWRDQGRSRGKVFVVAAESAKYRAHVFVLLSAHTGIAICHLLICVNLLYTVVESGYTRAQLSMA